MISIQGTVQIIPLSVSSDSGSITAEGQSPQSVVIQTLQTQNGLFQIVLPIEAISGIIDGLKNAQIEAEKEAAKADIYVPSSMGEVENIAKAKKRLEDEVGRGQ